MTSASDASDNAKELTKHRPFAMFGTLTNTPLMAEMASPGTQRKTDSNDDMTY